MRVFSNDMIPEVVKRWFPFLDEGGPGSDAPDPEGIGYPEEDDFPEEDDELA